MRVRQVTVDTPAWVRDAIFYQIFPDRFASSDRVHKPGRPRAVGRAADEPRLQGRRPARDRRAPRLPRGPRDHRDLPDADLQFGLEPPLPHVRLLRGRPAARRRRRPARAARRAHDRGMRVVLDGVFNHTGRGFWPFHHVLETGASSPYRRLVPPRRRAARRRPAAARLSAARDATDASSATRRGGACRPCRSSTPTHPEVREYLMSVAEHWLRFGIDGWRLDVPSEIDDEAFWQEFRRRCRAVRPDAYLVGEIWRVAPDWLRGDRFDALMNYPLGEAILGSPGWPTSTWRSCSTHHEYRLRRAAARRPGVRGQGRWSSPTRTTRTSSRSSSTSLGSHDAPRLRTVLGGDARRAPAGDAPPGDAARRAVDLLRRRGRPGGRQRPGLPRRVPVGRGRWEPGLRDSVRAAAPPAARRSRRCATARSGSPVPTGSAVALERGDGRVALRRGGQPRRARASRLDVRFERPAGGGARLEPVDLPGVRRHRRRPDRRTARATLDLPARFGFRPAHPTEPRPARISVILASCGRSPDRTRGRADRATGPRPRCRGKIPRAFEALGPVGGRDVLLLDGADGIRARQLAELGARVTFAATNGSSRIDAPDASADVVVSLWAAFRGDLGADPARGRPGPAPRRPPARPPRLRPRRRLAAARRPARLRAPEPARRTVPARRVQGPRRPLLLDVRLDRRGSRVPRGGLRRRSGAQVGGAR